MWTVPKAGLTRSGGLKDANLHKYMNCVSDPKCVCVPTQCLSLSMICYSAIRFSSRAWSKWWKTLQREQMGAWDCAAGWQQSQLVAGQPAASAFFAYAGG